MSKVVEMYYANLTNIDLGMILPNGRLVGNAFNLHLELKGEEDPVENVLIDFSTAKKRIKKWIDDHTGNGFDHKCWVTLHPSMQLSCSKINVTQDVENDGVIVSVPTGETIIEVNTPFTTLRAPANCFRFLNCMEDTQSHCISLASLPQLTERDIVYAAECEIASYLEERFAEDGETITVVATLTNNFSFPALSDPELNGYTFRYTHGLKHSTSFGCQNIAHGHISYLAFQLNASIWQNHDRATPGTRWFYETEIQSIIKELDQKTFIWDQNIAHRIPGSESEEPRIVVEYTSSRGTMQQSVYESDAIVMDVETTVEHIAEYVTETYRDTLTQLGVRKVYVSEGLEKGGISSVED